MAKVKNIKPEAPKSIKPEQLEKLQGLVKELNNIQMAIGGLEAQKASYIKNLEAGQEVLAGLRKELEEEYGSVQIDINTGAILEDAANS